MNQESQNAQDAPSFIDCGLSPELAKIVTDLGYNTPTPIQQKSIPAVLMGRDVIAVSQTGSGKTASFALPAIDILANQPSRARMPRCLILEPTRELASQVLDSITAYTKHVNLRSVLLIGGVAFDPQKKDLMAGADIIIATPGRLIDHIERSRLILTDINLLVIDEADRMLDMGFIPDIIKILKLLPKSRQTLLFSATMADEIKNLTHQFMTNPKQIEVSRPASTAQTIDQRKIHLTDRDKLPTLVKLLQQEEIKNGLIFCNRKKDISMVMKTLRGRDIKAEELHGDLDQHQRLRTLQAFRDGTINLLVCSDVAARGLDIPEVSHVFNLDVPTSAEDYVHRIGRTGRAGRTGKAIIFVAPNEMEYLADIEKLIQQKIPMWQTDNNRQADNAGDSGNQPSNQRRDNARDQGRDQGRDNQQYNDGRDNRNQGRDRGYDNERPSRQNQGQARGQGREQRYGQERRQGSGHGYGPEKKYEQRYERGDEQGQEPRQNSRQDSRQGSGRGRGYEQDYGQPQRQARPAPRPAARQALNDRGIDHGGDDGGDDALPSFLTTPVHKR
ncbi:MAG: DEAD/DEAH box helicase [Hydrotalea sp.]|nr:DEAD/DEAH box helicase [Hydrotalea sp.]